MACLMSVIFSTPAPAQEAANGQSILEGADGLSKGMECKSLPDNYEREARHVARLAVACFRACQMLENQMRSSPGVTPHQKIIDQCDRRYDKFKAAHDDFLANRGANFASTGTMPDVVGTLGSYNAETGRVDLRTRERMDWHMQCGSWAIVKNRSSGEFLRTTPIRKPLIRIVGIRPANEEKRALGCTAERIEVASTP